MTYLDWVVLGIYIIGIISLSWIIGLRQKTQDDYYLGGRKMSSLPIAFSIMATQVSAISLIGAPAFIALRSGGGLIWLQYEFAIPLAMMFIMLTLVPIYHQTKKTSIYEYLDQRFGPTTRTTISLIFLLSRGLGTGVALVATSIVTAVCLNWPLAPTILLIGMVAIIYTTFGGIVADIYSDIIQLVILWGGTVLAIILVISRLGQKLSTSSFFNLLAANQQRLHVFDFNSTGLGDGQTFSFWPMLIGGFFLYLSYYGCDQSQAQRLLTTSTAKEAQKSLLLNGLLRFPLVLTYCALGMLLIPFLQTHPHFVQQLAGSPADYLVPRFLINFIPPGILGLIVAGIFAASMSSIDSALNSLSAITYQDVLARIFPALGHFSDRQKVRLSRWITIAWGLIATSFALLMIGGSKTVLEMVNQIGSAFYGPVLAVFWLGILTKRADQNGAIVGLIGGVATNLCLWLFYETQVSWMWWNFIGFALAFIAGISLSRSSPQRRKKVENLTLSREKLSYYLKNKSYYFILLSAFIIFFFLGKIIELIFLG